MSAQGLGRSGSGYEYSQHFLAMGIGILQDMYERTMLNCRNLPVCHP